jgi:hypothetical protein
MGGFNLKKLNEVEGEEKIWKPSLKLMLSGKRLERISKLQPKIIGAIIN